MPTNSSNQINTHCTICRASTKIIAGRSHLCPRCKSNLAYITRHDQDSTYQLMDLKLRYLALINLKKNQRIGITEALRKALKDLNPDK